MSKEYPSEDQRILALEQAIPDIQRALGELTTAAQVNRVASGLDFIQPRSYSADVALFEQTLGVLRTLYLLPSPPPPPPPPDTPFPDPGIRVALGNGEQTEVLAEPGVETDVCFYIEVEVLRGSKFTVTLTKADGTMVTVMVERNKPKLIRGRYTSVKITGAGSPGSGTLLNVGIIRPC